VSDSIQFSRGCVVVMAKSPQLGKVKTRMQPQLSAAQSLVLHCELVETVITQLKQQSLAPLILQLTESHNFFEQFGLSMRLQCGDDLGARMAHAAQQALQDYDWVILLGADCPFIDADYLQQAMETLQDGVQAVVGPATDGGYVLLGLRAVNDLLFRDIRWGSDEVMVKTAERLHALNWQWTLLPLRDDIDCFVDLRKLHAHPRLAHWAFIDGEFV
jgi:rSAM/selenodomain-associated transferase 1